MDDEDPNSNTGGRSGSGSQSGSRAKRSQGGEEGDTGEQPRTAAELAELERLRERLIARYHGRRR